MKPAGMLRQSRVAKVQTFAIPVVRSRDLIRLLKTLSNTLNCKRIVSEMMVFAGICKKTDIKTNTYGDEERMPSLSCGSIALALRTTNRALHGQSFAGAMVIRWRCQGDPAIVLRAKLLRRLRLHDIPRLGTAFAAPPAAPFRAFPRTGVEYPRDPR